MCSPYKHKNSETCVFLYQAALLALGTELGTNTGEENRSPTPDPPGQIWEALLCSQDCLRIYQGVHQSSVWPRIQASAFSICFPERIKLASFFLTREAEPVISLTIPVVSWVPAHSTAPRQAWGAREHPLPLCSYPGTRECSPCSRETHPSQIPQCLLQRRLKTQFLLPEA